MRRKGLLVVMSAPSGTGKGTLLKLLKKKNKNLRLSVSATTRKPRKGEEEGRDYFFKTVDEFRGMIERDELVEWVEYCGNYYGTPKKYVEESLEQGFDVVLEIEVMGAVNIREKYPDSVLIFILPPSLEELARRIKGRGTEDEETIKKRIETAKMEITYIDRYDYIVVNSDIEAAVKDICCIMAAEKLKYGRIPDILNELGIVWQNQIDNCL